MNYDESIARAEKLIVQLEQADALSLDEYKRIAGEANTLLQQCKAEVERYGSELG